MKNITVITFLLISSNITFSQVIFPLNYTNDSDTVFWYQTKNMKIEKFKLGYIENDLNEVAFRIWSAGSTIEVAKKGNISVGHISYFVSDAAKDSKRIFKKNVHNTGFCSRKYF